ncbi:MAG: hypothetical protein EZS26_000099 [Candidatus Ordinivivax streblomastigis]|jgi:predicted DNA-binding transcriptional regulator YafY|uniref:Uncharacterized protein n=1 Tax=Candidatus Ordinivivax streblomastigis TaxID=2540710 RepID=A0A5M8P590_9BACT|nr:MAG: hypothetical protein EZS26_000099 [Candidatus Ordinivivax streblomastigis]
MLFSERINRLYNIHKWIQQGETGTPDEFAEYFHLSRRQLYNILDELKDYGADIRYSRTTHSYFYANEFDISINTLHFMSNNDENKFL